MNAVVELGTDLLATLEHELLSMPPVRGLGLRVARSDADSLTLAAPLALNVNDKGSAFGGSLSSVLTLAAWGLTTLRLAEHGLRADVYVQDSTLRYLAPLYDDIEARAWLDPDQDWPHFVETFRSRGRARVRLLAEVRTASGAVATTFEGRFVALAGR